MKKLIAILSVALLVSVCFLNRDNVDILIVGGGSELDLYVYIGTDREVFDSHSDDEKACLREITQSGYITIKVFSRGGSANDYRLIIK